MTAKKPIPAAAPNRAPKSGGVVTVACKIPMGMILRVYDFVERYVPAGAGTQRLAKIPVAREEEYRVEGYSVPFGQPHDKMLAGGYALTPGIPEDFFNLWLKQNEKQPYVKAGLIFAHRKMEDAQAEAREKVEIKSGLEPLSPDRNDPRTNVGSGPKVEKAEGVLK